MTGLSDAANTANDSDRIKVLIVDDSATVRTVLSDILKSDPAFEVMQPAADPYIAVERIRRQVPDVIFLDIEMPRMDGLTFLRKLQAQKPIPVIICSSIAESGSEPLMQALEAGAVDAVTKPRIDTAQFLHETRVRICDAAKAAAQARMRGVRRHVPPMQVESKLNADAVIPPLSVQRAASLAARTPATEPVICIGASTGGTEALRELLMALPADAPGIVIVQHMPEKFTAAFARRLNACCALEIAEARDGDVVARGRALIAPGNNHLVLKRAGSRYTVGVIDGQLVSRHRPSVDVLFRSAAQNAAGNAVGFILTGMGDDGATGLLEMRQAGAMTYAQDEESCVVFGMPQAAIEQGAAIKVLPLKRMAKEIMGYASISEYGS